MNFFNPFITIKLNHCISGLIVGFIMLGQTQAASIYSNLGPGDSFDSSLSTVFGSSQTFAAPFILSSDTSFGSAEFALEHRTGDNNYFVELMSDDGAGRPGEVIESLALNSVGDSAGIYGVNSILNSALLGGSQYWLAIRNNSGAGKWFLNNTGDEGLSWGVGNNPPPWTGLGLNVATTAFRINDIPISNSNGIPEPTTLALICFSLTGIGYGRYRQIKKA